MQNRRFIFFIIGSIAILIGNMLLWSKLNPPPPHPPADQKKSQPVAAKDKDAGEKAKAEPEKGADQNPVVENAPANAPAGAAEAQEPATAWFTLGSADIDEKNNPYKLLVTLTNKGAAVERIELSSPNFRDLENRSGYLGHLAAENSPDGVKVNIVAPGTPAAEAKLQTGDIITGINGKPIDNADALATALKDTSPNQKIEIAVNRDGQPQTLSATLGRRPLEVVRPEVFTQDMQIPEPLDVVAGSQHDPFSFLLTLWQIDKKAARRRCRH